MKIFFTKIAVLAAVGLSACKKEEKLNCTNLTAEFEKVLSLEDKFLNGPTVANCNASKSAAISFFNKLKDCPGADASEFDDLISEIKNNPCTEESIKEEIEESPSEY